MDHCLSLRVIKQGLFPWILKVWFIWLPFLFATVTLEDKVDAPSSGDIFCISECGTCPLICSPPPPPSPSSPPPPLPKSQSPPTPKSHSTPPPPSRSYNTPPPPPSSSGSSQPHPTVISGPNDNYYHPYYYFYASSSASYTSIQVPLFFLLLFLIGYPIVICE